MQDPMYAPIKELLSWYRHITILLEGLKYKGVEPVVGMIRPLPSSLEPESFQLLKLLGLHESGPLSLDASPTYLDDSSNAMNLFSPGKTENQDSRFMAPFVAYLPLLKEMFTSLKQSDDRYRESKRLRASLCLSRDEKLSNLSNHSRQFLASFEFRQRSLGIPDEYLDRPQGKKLKRPSRRQSPEWTEYASTLIRQEELLVDHMKLPPLQNPTIEEFREVLDEANQAISQVSVKTLDRQVERTMFHKAVHEARILCGDFAAFARFYLHNLDQDKRIIMRMLGFGGKNRKQKAQEVA